MIQMGKKSRKLEIKKSYKTILKPCMKMDKKMESLIILKIKNINFSNIKALI